MQHTLRRTAVASPVLALLAGGGCAVLWPCGEGARQSIGAPSHGALVNAVRVPERSANTRLFRSESEGGQIHTTRTLRDAVLESAQRVARVAPGGAPLVVGDFSAPFGGRIERHRSHRNGRDVDLLFFAVDRETGRSVPATGFVRYDRDGNPRDREATVRMDVERNWLLVESLVREERYGVLWVFCADWLKQRLVSWAREHGRDPRWIERAERVLHQPGDAAPHDDHFHVRVACTTEERSSGCLDGGPHGWWLSRALPKLDAAPQDDLDFSWESPERTLAPSPPAATRPRRRR